MVNRNRLLRNEDDVFSQNAWDSTEWTEEMLQEAEKVIERQVEGSKDTCKNLGDVEPGVSESWNQFYKAHEDKFFKDRRWIFSEFPELLDSLNQESQSCAILEVGCGVGNAVAHIVKSNLNPNLKIFCCDLSESAIEILKNRNFEPSANNNLTAFNADICSEFHKLTERIEDNSIDFITLIFTLSALKPEHMQNTIDNLATLLKPGGMILFRDYAKYDLTQLRFKSKSYLAENYYIRADGTTSYFFTTDLVDTLFTTAKLSKVQLNEDNRLLINRKKSLKMCRRWIQAKYRKE